MNGHRLIIDGVGHAHCAGCGWVLTTKPGRPAPDERQIRDAYYMHMSHSARRRR